MPAINVARTDTFEQQRVKINEIGQQIFTITEGGSDLSTGNLKLGDGTVSSPSLAFVSDTSLGLYKSQNSSLGFVSSSKKLVDLNLDSFVSFQDLIVRQRKLVQNGLSAISLGQNYDPGSYTDISVIGGTGQNATLDIEVIGWDGSITNLGSNYKEGQFLTVPLIGGNGSGATCNFEVEGIDGTITNAGSAYAPGVYQNVPLTNGSGTGAEATITVTGNATISGSITNPGSGYVDNTYGFVQLFNEPTQTFIVVSVPNPNAGQPGQPNYIYQIDGVVQPLLTMVAGNTYRFDMSDPSLDPSNGVDASANHRLSFQMADGSGIEPEFEFYLKGNTGTPGAFQDLVIKPTASTGTNVIRYDCANHPNMAPAGGNITVNTGTAGNYGSQAYAEITVSGNQITAINFLANGSGYKTGDILQVSNLDMGGSGSGFEYTISGLTFDGIVGTVVITENGIDYVDGDTLSANDADLGGGGGSGFEYTVSTNPGIIQNFIITDTGSGYQLNDVLSFNQGINNISTYIPAVSDEFPTSLTAGSATAVISDTSTLVSGMFVSTVAGDTGQIDQGTTILSIDSSTQITLSSPATVSGNANLVFTSTNLDQITVSSTSGINIGDVIEKVSGSGVLFSQTTVANVDDATTITLSNQAITPGPAIVNIVPPYGNPADDFSYTINSLGPVSEFTINNDGNGYSVGDLLTVNATDLTQPISIPVTTKFVQTLTFVQTISSSVFSAGDFVESPAGEITNITIVSNPDITPTVTGPLAANLTAGNPVVNLSSTAGISAGDEVTEDSSGNISPFTTVLSVDSATQITLSTAALQSASVNLTFTSNETGSFTGITNISGGTGTGASFDVQRNAVGQVTSVTLNSGGSGYSDGDTITIPGSEVGGTSPTHDIVVTVSSVTVATPKEVLSVQTSGGNITSILIESDQGNPISNADQLVKTGTTSPIYDVDTAGQLTIRYYIDPDGNGPQLTPDLTLYVGNTYRFDLSDPSNSATQFSFSEFPDGQYSPSLVENITVNLSNSSRIVTVPSTSSLSVGMVVTKVSGDGALESNTRIESIDSSTQITISELPQTSGSTVVNFSGTVYTDGVVQGQNYLDISISENTPTLYYYEANQYQDSGGPDNSEATITIDPNNPRIFGSGFQVRITNIQERDIVSAEVLDGTLTAEKIVSVEGEIDSLTSIDISTTTLNASTSVTTPTVTSSSALTLDASSIVCTNDFEVGLVSIEHSSGDITTSGEIETSNRLNINNKLFIADNVISTDASSDLVLSAPTGRLTIVNGFAALTIPSGTTVQRPTSATDGSIRFNTQTNQYEGYSSATTTWSSLGGVRDLDGNTTILAEETVGANDNTLWFINDNINTVRFTPTHIDFRNNKSIRSSNVSAPAFTNWTANTPVTLGQYLKYRNNLYEVTVAGTTATSGNEPIHTTGAVANGSAELTWSQLAVAPLTFEDIEVLRIGPLGGLPVSINNDLRLANNVISTDINDLVIRPNSGKKVVIDAPTTLVLPAGADADRGIPSQGSIRFSTTSSQFEGYDGTNWGSLGGVKDVNQNTYIIPELSPGSDEDILYFFNDNNNTLQLTTTSLDFYSVDTIRSVTSDELEITASLLTFDNGASTFDNTAVDRTFLSTTKQYFDLGLSAGLTTDPVLRLDDQGDVYLNIGFGTGVYNGVKVFDGDLKEFELADVRILTEKLTLVKGTSENGNSVIYATASDAGSKTTVLAINPTTGDKEFFEFGIIDDGTDVFHTEYGNIRTGVQLIIPTFEVTGANTVRINITLGSGVNPTEAVNITVVSNITKK